MGQSTTDHWHYHLSVTDGAGRRIDRRAHARAAAAELARWGERALIIRCRALECRHGWEIAADAACEELAAGATLPNWTSDTPCWARGR